MQICNKTIMQLLYDNTTTMTMQICNKTIMQLLFTKHVEDDITGGIIMWPLKTNHNVAGVYDDGYDTNLHVCWWWTFFHNCHNAAALD